jgi:ring-1,2-phenylacetyl-CoA epoxidase subunit PaaC
MTPDRPEYEEALAARLLALADDELLLAHRNSEWTGHAPILEEDIALANIAQDELGHAVTWYGLYAALTGADPDELAFFRDAEAFRNVQMVAYPKGDWAFTLVRQYLFDAAEATLLPHLAGSAYRPLAEAAAKVRQEEIYHYRHSSLWMRRLGLGTAESRQRTQGALNVLWPLAHQLFVPTPGEAELVEAGVVPASSRWRAEWDEVVRPFLSDCSLTIPADAEPPAADRAVPSAFRADLLAEMQEVARAFPEAKW